MKLHVKTEAHNLTQRKTFCLVIANPRDGVALKIWMMAIADYT